MKCAFFIIILSVTLSSKEISGQGKKSKSKLKLQLGDHVKSYSDAIVLIYNPKIGHDRLMRFEEVSLGFDFNKNQDIGCSPEDHTCAENLLQALNTIDRTDAVVLLIDPDRSILNIHKDSLLKTYSSFQRKIVVDQESIRDHAVGVQLVADIQDLKVFLQDPANREGSLREIFNRLDQTKMKEFHVTFQDQLPKAKLFEKIDPYVLGVSLFGIISKNPGESRLQTEAFESIAVLSHFNLEDSLLVSKLNHISNFLSAKKPLSNKILPKKDYPRILVAIIVDRGAIFVEEFFDKVSQLQYSPSQLDIYISCQEEKKLEFVKLVAEKWKKIYKSVHLEEPFRDVITSHQSIRNHALNIAKTDYVFFVRSVAQIEDPEVLTNLVQTSTEIVGPLFKTYHTMRHVRQIKPEIGKWNLGVDNTISVYKASMGSGNVTGIKERFQVGVNFLTMDDESKFWEQMDEKNTYFRLADFKISDFHVALSNMLKNDFPWRVKSLRYVFLLKSEILDEVEIPDGVDNNDSLEDILFKNLILKGFCPKLLNDRIYGQLVNMMALPTNKKHPELYRFFENHDLWERRYILEAIRDTETNDPLETPKVWPAETVFRGPCPDTFEIPLATEMFCDHLVEESEHSQLWHPPNITGGNFDSRFGHIETAPAYDIGIYQLNFEEVWIAVLNTYIGPRKVTMFPAQLGFDLGGHFFIIRYNPDEQPDLRPHDDNSLYTINIALNRPGVDFEGGGTRFLRYDCNVPDLKKGHALIHPGRLTHYHEGLATTKGTRYVFISFVQSSLINSCYKFNGKFNCDSLIKTMKESEGIFEGDFTQFQTSPK